MSDTELDASELGTKTYWQSCYSKEISNFEDHGDVGEIWFGEDSANRVIDWICDCGVGKDEAVVDLGCGNGYTLLELAKAGFTNLLGVDYCEEAITLAKKVTEKEFPSIKYKKFDITQDNIDKLDSKFGLIHDKGTYDAISLNPENPKLCRTKYIERVANMLDDRGIFVITSCNWTDMELVKHFGGRLQLKCVVPTPLFKFGGKTGSMVSSVVFVHK